MAGRGALSKIFWEARASEAGNKDMLFDGLGALCASVFFLLHFGRGK